MFRPCHCCRAGSSFSLCCYFRLLDLIFLFVSPLLHCVFYSFSVPKYTPVAYSVTSKEVSTITLGSDFSTITDLFAITFCRIFGQVMYLFGNIVHTTTQHVQIG